MEWEPGGIDSGLNWEGRLRGRERERIEAKMDQKPQAVHGKAKGIHRTWPHVEKITRTGTIDGMRHRVERAI